MHVLSPQHSFGQLARPEIQNLITSQVTEVRATNPFVGIPQQEQLSDKGRSVHSVPDPSLVDRLSESRDEVMWQSMIDRTDYNY